MKEELKKLYRGRLVWSLMLLSVIANAYLLFLQRDKIPALVRIDDFCREYGGGIEEEKTAVLGRLWSRGDHGGIAWEEFEKDIERAAEYRKSVQGSHMAEAYCVSQNLSGRAAEYVREVFGRLEGAIREGAQRELTYFAPSRMRVFDTFATYLLFAVNLEGIVVAVIVSLYCADLERSSRTVSTVYSTKRGRRILKDKLLASVAASAACLLTIAVITAFLGVCFFPVKTILNTEMSNPLVHLKGAPCFTRESMTIGTYMIVSICISCVLAVVYSLGSFWLGLKAKNAYYAVGVLVVLLGIMEVASTAAPRSELVFFWAQYNPLDMARRAGTWLLYGANSFSPPGYEAVTAALWGTVCAAGCISALGSMGGGLDRRISGRGKEER